MTRLVLASASTGRRRVLRHAGVDPVVIVSGVDEDAVAAALPVGAGPAVVTTALAAAKAEAVARTVDPALAADAVVIGCDSMLYLDGELRGKPGTAQRARAEWQQMVGTCGELFTGHCAIRLRDGKIIDQCSESSSTTVHFGTPADVELDAYIASGEPLGVAGAFTLDGLGGWFIERIDGDPSAVIGIGLPLIRRLLHRLDISVDQLWAANPLR